MRKTDLLVISCWGAIIFGGLEGAVHCFARSYPVLQAAHKVSPDILWAAPIASFVFFIPVAVGLALVLSVLEHWFVTSQSLVRLSLVVIPVSILAVILTRSFFGIIWLVPASVAAIIGLGLLIHWAPRRVNSSPLLLVYGLYFFLGAFIVSAAPGIVHPACAAVLSLGLATALCRGLRGAEERLTNSLRKRLVYIPVLLVGLAVGSTTYSWANEEWHFRGLGPSRSNTPNVLVIVLDTVRYDRFAPETNKSITPNIDRIVAKGVRFDNAWSTTSWSLPSQASILTGRYPHEHGADWPDFQLARECPTLGEFLAGQGYVTGAFSGNAAWITPEYLGRGFLRFEVYNSENLVRRTVVGRMADQLLCKIGYHSAGRGRKAPAVNDLFLRFVDDYRHRPFFAYLCYMDVNQGFHDCRFNRYFGKLAPTPEVVEAYDQSLRELDRQVGALFDRLQQRKLLDNTIVIITSDHGESFGADDTLDRDPAGHGTSLYREQTKVPLYVVYPPKVPSEQAITRTVSIRDIPTTVASLLELQSSPFEGSPLILPGGEETSSQKPADDSVFANLKYDGRHLQSLIWNGWQYIADLKNSETSEELYDLKSDCKQQKNLAPSHPILSSIEERLQRLLRQGSQSP